MTRRQKRLTHEQAYIKAICRIQREEIGFSPTLTQRNHKKYNRSEAKRLERELIEF